MPIYLLLFAEPPIFYQRMRHLFPAFHFFPPMLSSGVGDYAQHRFQIGESAA